MIAGGGEDDGVVFPESRGQKRRFMLFKAAQAAPIPGLPTASKVCKTMIMRSCEHAMSRAHKTIQGDVVTKEIRKKKDSNGGQSRIARIEGGASS